MYFGHLRDAGHESASFSPEPGSLTPSGYEIQADSFYTVRRKLRRLFGLARSGNR